MNIAVVGASDKPDRYSYKALMLLKQKGYDVFPVHVRLKEIEGIRVYKTIQEIKDKIDIITLYVNADISDSMDKEIISKKPSLVIFNPGAENPSLSTVLQNNGIQILEACTLVMLHTGKL